MSFVTARDTILASIRRSLAAPGDDVKRRAAVADRLQRAPRGLIPERANVPAAERLALFEAMARKVNASVERVASDEQVPTAVAAYLRSKNLAPRFRRGEDPRLAALPWESEPNLEIALGPSSGDDPVAVSHAFAGIAETGTLVLLSGPDNPTTLNFLPDDHIVVVRAEEVAGDMETVWRRVRDTCGKGAMPRAVNMITGPSRSGDIEQTMILGAHGPRALHVVLVGAEADAGET